MLQRLRGHLVAIIIQTENPGLVCFHIAATYQALFKKKIVAGKITEEKTYFVPPIIQIENSCVIPLQTKQTCLSLY